MEKKNLKMRSLIAGILLLFLFAAGCGADEELLFTEQTSTQQEEENPAEEIVPETTDVSEKETVEEENIMVHICGAVQKPGVYELDPGSRVVDAVSAAGGFLPQADSEYVNLATPLSDGAKIRIPTMEETTELSFEEKSANDTGVTEMTEQSEGTKQSLVNINTADAAQLCTLPGIGETRAEGILQYRREHGPFSRIEDIMQVSGIKESSFQKIKDYITVNGT